MTKRNSSKSTEVIVFNCFLKEKTESFVKSKNMKKKETRPQGSKTFLVIMRFVAHDMLFGYNIP